MAKAMCGFMHHPNGISLIPMAKLQVQLIKQNGRGTRSKARPIRDTETRRRIGISRANGGR